MIDSIKRMLGMFDSNGLRHSVAHLENIRPEVPYMTIPERAKYVDVVTKTAVDEPDYVWLHHQMDQDVELSVLHQANTVAFGNLAYIALYAPLPYCTKAQKILTNYSMWLQEFNNKLNPNK